MFILTVDQRDSRHGADRVEPTMRAITRTHTGDLIRRPERTAGDEFQLAVADPTVTVAIALSLSAEGAWSIGIGIGDVDEPLPPSVRAGSGEAFLLARDAVTAAKRSAWRVAIRGGSSTELSDRNAEAVAELLIALRDRRGAPGWEVAGLLESGLSQTHIAERLAISPSAVSQRIKTAAIGTERAGRDTLATLLRILDDSEGTPA
ncbi:hypothetical protein [Mycetocola reblochoni]|uniref:DNA-binding protein n=2 Tax=Mycetocola reblochoni TaxID=331618 RepID=A0A3L6ZJI7_9MICO|nr:hypothetical protein [Mycetocola reblochoni]RLP68149.1 hypothetical protein D9V30_11645 [Mycetocola reblochoni]SJN17876.1 hypothetical membrane associated protein [Mycetocola reblochoni REB411]